MITQLMSFISIQYFSDKRMSNDISGLEEGKTAVITGDITQIDLPRGKDSGLRHVIDILKEEDDISFTFFKSRDIVRHPLVAKILNAYERHELGNHRR